MHGMKRHTWCRSCWTESGAEVATGIIRLLSLQCAHKHQHKQQQRNVSKSPWYERQVQPARMRQRKGQQRRLQTHSRRKQRSVDNAAQLESVLSASVAAAVLLGVAAVHTRPAHDLLHREARRVRHRRQLQSRAGNRVRRMGSMKRSEAIRRNGSGRAQERNGRPRQRIHHSDTRIQHWQQGSTRHAPAPAATASATACGP